MTRRARLAIIAAIAAAGALAVVVAWPRARRPVPVAPAVAATPGQLVALRHAVAERAVAQATSREQLQARWNETPERTARVELIEAAAHTADEHAIEFLVGIASTQDPLAPQAGAAIGRIGDRRRAAELARLASSDLPVLVRANAARALARAGSHEQAAELAALVASSATPQRVRQEAALALARIGDDDAAAVLGQTLDALAPDATDGARQLRLAIIEGLGGIGSDAARAALLRHRARELSDTERAFVEHALAAVTAT